MCSSPSSTALTVFQGHFPGNPIVPGVLLIETVRCTAERHLRRRLTIIGLERVKFKGLVRPEDPITVTASLCPSSSGTEVRATLQRQGDTVASMVLEVIEA